MATRARETLDGYSFLNRTLVVRYAKSKSHALMKLDGTYPDLLRKASPPSRPRPPSPPAAPLSSRRGEQCGGRQVREDFLDAERTAAEERAAQEAALLAPRTRRQPAAAARRAALRHDGGPLVTVPALVSAMQIRPGWCRMRCARRWL